jgi:hypothetical protein
VVVSSEPDSLPFFGRAAGIGRNKKERKVKGKRAKSKTATQAKQAVVKNWLAVARMDTDTGVALGLGPRF